jgi:hypothetical protein
MHGEGPYNPFYSCVSRRSNVGLCNERGREVTTQIGAAVERVSTRAMQSAARAAMGTVKGMREAEILSVHRRQGGELDREGAGHGHAARMGVPAHGAYAARRGARELEARRAARGVSKEGGTRGTGIVAAQQP